MSLNRSLDTPEIAALEKQLNAFDAEERSAALEALIAKAGDALPAPKPEVNLHFHTFFSFNAEGWSPSRVAWEAARYGLEVAGSVDFDVLDAMDEFLEAGDRLGIKTVAGIESRVFFAEYAEHELNSPKEPGVAYFMGCGFFRRPDEGTPAAKTLRSMYETAQERNLGMMERVNTALGQVQLNYDRDAMTLTPGGNPTERHLLVAYDAKAREVFGSDRDALVRFWSDVLGSPATEIAALLHDTPRFHERIRSKLMKFGGVGYVAPDAGSFPSLEDAIAMIRGAEALPTYAYLDGTSSGEDDIRALLEYCVGKGVVAMNIIPDRNWNIPDPAAKALKVRKLGEAVEAARALDLPLCVGTEMNKAGLPFVDSFRAPELAPFVNDFLRGARFFYGHTLLARFAGFGYWSDGAEEAFGSDRAKKNAFFARMGEARPGEALRERLLEKFGQWTAEELELIVC